eukprot:gene5994-1003_t
MLNADSVPSQVLQYEITLLSTKVRYVQGGQDPQIGKRVTQLEQLAARIRDHPYTNTRELVDFGRWRGAGVDIKMTMPTVWFLLDLRNQGVCLRLRPSGDDYPWKLEASMIPKVLVPIVQFAQREFAAGNAVTACSDGGVKGEVLTIGMVVRSDDTGRHQRAGARVAGPPASVYAECRALEMLIYCLGVAQVMTGSKPGITIYTDSQVNVDLIRDRFDCIKNRREHLILPLRDPQCKWYSRIKRIIRVIVPFCTITSPVMYVKAHTGDKDIPSQLNSMADEEATKAYKLSEAIPGAKIVNSALFPVATLIGNGLEAERGCATALARLDDQHWDKQI